MVLFVYVLKLVQQKSKLQEINNIMEIFLLFSLNKSYKRN